MTPEPAEALMERVRQGFAEAEAMSLPAEDALTELAERVKAAEANDAKYDRILRMYEDYRERAEAAERERDTLDASWKVAAASYEDMRRERDELVEALERLADPLCGAETGEMPYKIAEAALAKVRGEAE